MKRHFSEFMQYRHLLYELVSSEIKVKYRRSFLGVIWSVLQPLGMMIILTVVFSTMFKSDIEHFPVYVLTGRIVWDLVSLSTSFALTSVVSNSSLIKKVYIPKNVFPLARSLSALVNCAFSMIALFIVVGLSGVDVTYTILFVPIPLILLYLFTVGIGLVVSSLTVFFRDLAHLYELLLTAWMYLTPIFYPAEILPAPVLTIMHLNPVYYYLVAFRDMVMYGQMPTMETWMICFSMAILSLFVGFFIFSKSEDKFIMHI